MATSSLSGGASRATSRELRRTADPKLLATCAASTVMARWTPRSVRPSRATTPRQQKNRAPSRGGERSARTLETRADPHNEKGPRPRPPVSWSLRLAAARPRPHEPRALDGRGTVRASIAARAGRPCLRPLRARSPASMRHPSHARSRCLSPTGPRSCPALGSVHASNVPERYRWLVGGHDVLCGRSGRSDAQRTPGTRPP